MLKFRSSRPTPSPGGAADDRDARRRRAPTHRAPLPHRPGPVGRRRGRSGTQSPVPGLPPALGVRQGSSRNPRRRRHVVGGAPARRGPWAHLRAAPVALAGQPRRPPRARSQPGRLLAARARHHRPPPVHPYRAPAVIPVPRWAAPEPTALDPRAVRVLDGATGGERTISVTHPSGWAGPACDEASPTRRAAALADYAVHLAGRQDLIERARIELAGHALACACAPGGPCHRDILLDVAQPPADPYRGGHGLAVTLPRPWGSLIVLPETLSGATIHTRSWCTDYRGALCGIGSRRL